MRFKIVKYTATEAVVTVAVVDCNKFAEDVVNRNGNLSYKLVVVINCNFRGVHGKQFVKSGVKTEFCIRGGIDNKVRSYKNGKSLGIEVFGVIVGGFFGAC